MRLLSRIGGLCMKYRNIFSKTINIQETNYNKILNQSVRSVFNLTSGCRSSITVGATPINQQVRGKYGKKAPEPDEEEDQEDETEYKDEQDSKIVKTTVNSLRADLILKAGLALARNKVEVVFYESRVRVNGQKIAKKAMTLNIDDEVDVIKSFSAVNPLCLIVSRVVVLSATPRSDGGFKVVLRRYKNLLIDNYKGPNEYKSSHHDVA